MRQTDFIDIAARQAQSACSSMIAFAKPPKGRLRGVCHHSVRMDAKYVVVVCTSMYTTVGSE